MSLAIDYIKELGVYEDYLQYVELHRKIKEREIFSRYVERMKLKTMSEYGEMYKTLGSLGFQYSNIKKYKRFTENQKGPGKTMDSFGVVLRRDGKESIIIVRDVRLLLDKIVIEDLFEKAEDGITTTVKR